MKANPPIAVLSGIDLNSITGKRVLIDVLNHLWLRSGGPVDLTSTAIVTMDTEDSRRFPELRNLSKKVSYLAERIDAIPCQASELRALRKRIEALEAKENHFPELKSIKQKLATLEA